MSGRNLRFTLAAWLFVAYLVAVILFGAYVRISHSGDGCGSNWPTCHGDIVPASPSTATLVEFTHRVTSGLCGLLGLGLLGWAWRLHGTGTVTRDVALTVVFILIEGAIGAGLVLGELVGDDDSVARAVVIALHLANTLALTAFASLAAWRSSRPGPISFLSRRRAVFAFGIVAVVATSATGAVTALGDTLFPREVSIGPGLLAEVGSDLSAGNHFLVRLRVLHPALALAAAGYLLWLLGPEADRNVWAKAAMYLVAAQVSVGFLSIALSAPAWVQIVHLLAAHAVWIALILAAASLAPRGAVLRA